MPLPSETELALVAFVAPLYAGKDTMHDWTHVERVRRRAIQFAEDRPCDLQRLALAAALHGVIYSHEPEIRAFLVERGAAPDDGERLVAAAWQSQKEVLPQSIEGQILHDAHLLEGDENFIVTKTLATGSARGQSLAQTVAWFEANVGRHQCFFPEHQREYARREEIARAYLRKLKAGL